MKGRTYNPGLLAFAAVPRHDLRSGLSLDGLQALVGQYVLVPTGYGARWRVLVLGWVLHEAAGAFLTVVRRRKQPLVPSVIHVRLNQVDLA